MPRHPQLRPHSASRGTASRGLRWARSATWIVLEWVLFLAAAVWITWPLATHWTTSLPLGCEVEPVVPLFNLWTEWWNVDRLGHVLADYWRAPIFFPAEHAFAFSEPQPATGLGAWLLAPLLPSPEAVYNGLLWIHLALNGWCTHLLFRSWRASWGASLLAGLMVEWMPAVHWQLGVVQLVPLWGAALTLLFLLRFSRRPAPGSAIGLGISAGLTYLLCSYYGLMFGILVLITSPVLVRRRHLRLINLRWVALAGLIAVLVAGPIVWKQRQVARQSSAIPPRELVAELSSHPVYLLRTPWQQWIAIPGIGSPSPASPWAFSPGTIKLVLAGVGIWTGLRCPRHRRRTLFLAALVVIGSGLAMGPTLAVAGYGPYDLLVAICPGYSQLRNIYRFATFAQLALVILAGLGVAWIGQELSRRATRSSWPALAALHVGGALAAVVVLLESLPASPRLWATPAAPPSWVAVLEQHSEPTEVIALFPMPRDNTLAEARLNALAMYWQMRHQRAMVNGYSGLVPPQWVERETRLRNFPTVETLAELSQTGVDLVIVPAETVPQLRQAAQRHPLREVMDLEQIHLDDENGVFRLRRRAP